MKGDRTRQSILDRAVDLASIVFAIMSRTAPGRPSNSNEAAAKKHPPGKTLRRTYEIQARQIATRRG